MEFDLEISKKYRLWKIQKSKIYNSKLVANHLPKLYYLLF